MFRRLFARLTGEPQRGQALFNLAVAEARPAHWFLEGGVPDTVNGRFAVLATIVALITVRLESAGPEGADATVALTERLVESLDTEIREMGVGDPTLGKQVRRLVGSVGARVERWRSVIGQKDWGDEVQRSLDLDETVDARAVAHDENALRDLWKRLSESSVEQLAEGRTV
jgi:cytochrome b pre-mRNA-processing protein 3